MTLQLQTPPNIGLACPLNAAWRLDDKDLYSGLIRLHVLHHACKGPIFGLWIIEKLREHGYRLSPGTVYPMLHAMETKGYLTVTMVWQGRRIRRTYRATALGRAALKAARKTVRELFGELFDTVERSRRSQQSRRAGYSNSRVQALQLTVYIADSRTTALHPTGDAGSCGGQHGLRRFVFCGSPGHCHRLIAAGFLRPMGDSEVGHIRALG